MSWPMLAGCITSIVLACGIRTVASEARSSDGERDVRRVVLRLKEHHRLKPRTRRLFDRPRELTGIPPTKKQIRTANETLHPLIPDAVASGEFVAVTDGQPAEKTGSDHIGRVQEKTYLYWWDSCMIPAVKHTFEDSVMLKETRDSFLQQTLDAFSAKVLKLERFGGELNRSTVQFDEIEHLLYEGLREVMKSMNLNELTPQSAGPVFQEYGVELIRAVKENGEEYPAAVRAVKALRTRLDKVLEARSDTPAGRREARRWEFREQLVGLNTVLSIEIEWKRNISVSSRQGGCLTTQMRKTIRRMEPPEEGNDESEHEVTSRLASLIREFYLVTREDNPLFAPKAVSVHPQKKQEQFFDYKETNMSDEAKRIFEELAHTLAQRCGIDLPG